MRKLGNHGISGNGQIVDPKGQKLLFIILRISVRGSQKKWLLVDKWMPACMNEWMSAKDN